MTKSARLWCAIIAVTGVVLGGLGFAVLSVPYDLGADAAKVQSHPDANVPVSVAMSADGRRLVLEIDWDDELDDAPGSDHFTARVMAGVQEVEQKEWRMFNTKWTISPPDVYKFAMRFNQTEATALISAAKRGDAVVAVSQQSDADGDGMYEMNYVTVVRIPAPVTGAARFESLLPTVMQTMSVGGDTASATVGAATKDCSQIPLILGAGLFRCDLHGANLASANLVGVDLTKANLTGANLVGANLTKANLTGANLTGTVCPDGSNPAGRGEGSQPTCPLLP
tara:strand:- start:481 stop:1326 length:846 start_codon:yes stop_codon:yes gene_type:complete